MRLVCLDTFLQEMGVSTLVMRVLIKSGHAFETVELVLLLPVDFIGFILQYLSIIANLVLVVFIKGVVKLLLLVQ